MDHERQPPVYFVDHSGREVGTDNLSSGEKEFLYFFSFLRKIRHDKSMIVLIDEPELHLHSSQVRKICEMLAELAEHNQVIVATHSSDVLHHFLYTGRVILLERGKLGNVDFPEDMRALVDRLGLPVDPSVFTAHWIVAENRSETLLPGEAAPRTEEVLRWLFGGSLHQRYWAFGSSMETAEGSVELLQRASSRTGDIRLSVILDGDRTVEGVETWMRSARDADVARHIHRLPCWELENLFLSPEFLRAASEPDEDLEGSFWRLLRENESLLSRTVEKTIIKNQMRKTQRKNRIDISPWDNFESLKTEYSSIEQQSSDISLKISELIERKDWKWIPGKEALGLLVGLTPNYWRRVRDLADISGIITADEEISALVDEVLVPEHSSH